MTKAKKDETGGVLRIRLSPMMSTALIVAERKQGGIKRTEIARRYIVDGLIRDGIIEA